jgi:UDP-3-O-[3-hydroxymyristoyl] N-acetylglucosamine deacetylase
LLERITKVKEKIIQAHISNALPAKLCTTISNKHVSVSTIEHLMSALSGMGIDNAIVEVDGPGVADFRWKFKRVRDCYSRCLELQFKAAEKKYIKILKKIIVKDKEKSISIEPTNKNKLEIDYEIDFHDRVIKKQSKKIDLEKMDLWKFMTSERFAYKKILKYI